MGEGDLPFKNSFKCLEVEGGGDEGRAEGGEKEGTSLKHKAQKIISPQRPTLKQERVGGEGEEAGGSSSYMHAPKSKLNVHSDSMMELLTEIQTDIKAKYERIEQVLVSHTRAIEQVLAGQSSQIRAIAETKAAVHDTQVAIEVVRLMATCAPSSSTHHTLTLEKKEAFEQEAKDLENAIQNMRETRVGMVSHHLQADLQSTPPERGAVDLRALMPVYISESGRADLHFSVRGRGT